MAEASETYKQELAIELNMLSEQNEETKQALERIREKLVELRTKPGLEGLRPQEMLFVVSNLRREVSNYRQNLAYHRSRLELAELQSVEVKPIPIQELAAEWQKIVDFRQAKLEELRTRVQQEAISPVELAEFEARLAEARAKLLNYTQPPLRVRRSRGVGPRGRIQPPQVTEGMVMDVEGQLIQALERLEKLDGVVVMQIATELEDREKEEQILKEKVLTLAKQIEKVEQDLRLTDTFTFKVLGE